MSFFWFSLVFMQEQLCSRVHSYGINLDVNCVGYTSGNEIIDFFSIWKCLICFYYLFQFSLASMLQEQASGKNTPLNPKHLRFEAGNSNILNQHDKTKILSYVSYSKCLAKMKNKHILNLSLLTNTKISLSTQVTEALIRQYTTIFWAKVHDDII